MNYYSLKFLLKCSLCFPHPSKWRYLYLQFRVHISAAVALRGTMAAARRVGKHACRRRPGNKCWYRRRRVVSPRDSGSSTAAVGRRPTRCATVRASVHTTCACCTWVRTYVCDIFVRVERPSVSDIYRSSGSILYTWRYRLFYFNFLIFFTLIYLLFWKNRFRKTKKKTPILAIRYTHHNIQYTGHRPGWTASTWDFQSKR